MELQINNDFKIISEPRQYILCKRVHTKTGKERWKHISFFISLASAFKSVPDTILRESDAKGWEECLKVLQEIRDIIKEGIEKQATIIENDHLK